MIDTALILWFPAPSSFTGEDVAELQVHGGRAVVSTLLRVLGSQPGCRLAEPGEFTRRAFLNSRLDLAAVEGLADLIDAETEAQRRQAQRLLDGTLTRWVAAQRESLVQALAAVESAIDFADEGDVAGDFTSEVHRHLRDLGLAVDEQIALWAGNRRVREGLVVALAGPPNAGKSSLLNALARREAAIVSPYPGTTRDPIEVDLDLDGCLVRVIDTAGLRDTTDPLEREGIARTRLRANSADVVLWLTDVRAPRAPDRDIVAAVIWRIATKIDLAAEASREGFDYAVSTLTGTGVPELLRALRGAVEESAAEAGVATRERHRGALLAAKDVLDAVRQEPGMPLEIVAVQLRRVATLLDGLVGTVATEDVLGVIFARFCIGK